MHKTMTSIPTIFDIRNIVDCPYILTWEVMVGKSLIVDKTLLLETVPSPIVIVIHPPLILAQGIFHL